MTNLHSQGRGQRPRVAFVGVDGASWDVMRPLLDDGQLPNLAALLARGAGRPLLSTRPPISPVAWATMMTGVNPGRHGVTGWADLVTRRVFSSGDVHAPFVWDLLTRAGTSVGVFNIPMTYPAEAVNGYMVAGEIGTVDYDARMFHPAGLLAEAREQVPDYPLPAAEAERTRYGFDRLQANARARYDLLAHLLRAHPTEVVIAGVNYVDYAQHTLVNSRRGPDGEDVVAWAYREADRFLGLVMEHLADDACIVVASDHGAGPVEGYVNLPGLLRDLGLLVVRGRSPAQRLLWRLRRGGVAISRLLRSTGQRELLGRARKSLRSRAYDWRRTIAYAVPASYGVALNTGERSPSPAVAVADISHMARQVAEAIEQVINPLTGERDLRTFLAEDEYHGPMVATAPEVLIEARECRYHLLSVGADEPAVFLTPEELAERHPALDRWQGMHRPEGVLVVSGPGLSDDALAPEPTVMDIAPTLLALAGVAVADGVLDGRAMVSAGEERVALSGADVAEVAGARGAAQYSPEEARRIEKRLEDLGYL